MSNEHQHIDIKWTADGSGGGRDTRGVKSR